MKIKDGTLVRSSVRTRHSLGQLEKQQRRLEHSLNRSLAGREWLERPPRGRELI